MKTRTLQFGICIVISAISINSTAQTISTIAGDGTLGYLGDGGPATNAELYWPTGSLPDNAGNVYIADSRNNRVRKITASGAIITVAGNGSGGFFGDGGPATAALIGNPTDVVIDKWGNFYITDIYNHVIRKVSPSGIITTVAGSGTSGFAGDGGPATNAKFFYPEGIVADTSGNIFIADRENGRVRKVDASGMITTIAGTGSTGPLGDGGPATDATISGPCGLCVDHLGNLFIAEYTGEIIRKINPSGIISTSAGSTAGFGGDGGPATLAQLDQPKGVSCDVTGNLYISDWQNNRIRKVTLAATTAAALINSANINSLYPNPATTEITITSTADISNMAIINIFGEIVYSEPNHSNPGISPSGIYTKNVQIGNLPQGVYFITINGSMARKFIKE